MFRSRMLLVWFAIAFGACSSSPRVTTVQPLSDSSDAPYENVLVIFLFSKFDQRRYLETEVVDQLSALGIQAVASTSLMDTRTPVTRQTFLAMVEEIDADAVLVTQFANIGATGKKVDMNPQSTYNFRPTYYYNVWSVDVEEYVEPQAIDMKFSLALATQLYSASTRDVVWAIESKSDVKRKFDRAIDYTIYADEATAIVRKMSRDGLIGP
ncbi:MAG: hypothetical protein ACR2Q3_01700 [Woeseiaceae bacterium]